MKTHKKYAGFTLIELLLIVAILGLLIAIAIPTYQDQVRKARRAKAIAALTDIAAREEAYFTQHFVYADSLETLGITDAAVRSNNQVIYELSFNPPSNETSNSDTSQSGDSTQEGYYIVYAIPQGDQANDPCGTLSIDSVGRKSDQKNGQCWP
jgi:type IV pilus assembly protein PilE